ncbi:DUF2087 domain-containing protein [Paenibacillus macerans]|uniref:DUF2087 domain-containing protein n=2 Tax=Paenibacillus macerans TaxID=44252 RepID=UPI003D291B53
MEIDRLSVEDLKRGFSFQEENHSYICNICGKTFETGEIYRFNNRFFEAVRAADIHAETEHGDNLKQLLDTESKYNNFTDNQKQLLWFMYSGLTDKEIAAKLGVSLSTVRHQRFMFREKAKQAKMYLAVYEQVMAKKPSMEDAIVPVHDHATMVDDRYVTTEKERDQTLKTAFESLSPLKLIKFPAKEKKKIVVLSKIAEQFQPDKRYSETELNHILKEIYEDYAVIRRYLVDYGFMGRTDDGQEYWLN